MGPGARRSATGAGDCHPFVCDGLRRARRLHSRWVPDGDEGKGNLIKVSDANTGEELNNLQGHTGEIWAIALDRQGRWLATAGVDTTIRIWAADSWKPVRTLRGHTGVIMSLTFSPDGDYLVSGSRDHTVKVWETARWKDSQSQ